MEFYLAPMEGITGYVYRNQLHKDFGGVTKFMTPFLAPVPKKVLKTKEQRRNSPGTSGLDQECGRHAAGHDAA